MQIVVPTVSKPTEEIIQQQMARLFNILPFVSLAHVSVNDIIFEPFLKAAVAVNNNEVYWPRMIAFCTYAQFLLVSSSGDCDPKIMHILDQVESGFNPMPVILAETLTGLDNLPLAHRFAGSPLLLEVNPLFFLTYVTFCRSGSKRR